MEVYIVRMENNHIDSVWSSLEAAKEYLNKSSYCYADNDRTPGRNTLHITEWNVRDKYESPLYSDGYE